MLVSAAANWGLLILLTETFGMYYLIANGIGFGVDAFLNYTLSDPLVFSAGDTGDDSKAGDAGETAAAYETGETGAPESE